MRSDRNWTSLGNETWATAGQRSAEPDGWKPYVYRGAGGAADTAEDRDHASRVKDRQQRKQRSESQLRSDARRAEARKADTLRRLNPDTGRPSHAQTVELRELAHQTGVPYPTGFISLDSYPAWCYIYDLLGKCAEAPRTLLEELLVERGGIRLGSAKGVIKAGIQQGLLYVVRRAPYGIYQAQVQRIALKRFPGSHGPAIGEEAGPFHAS